MLTLSHSKHHLIKWCFFGYLFCYREVNWRILILMSDTKPSSKFLRNFYFWSGIIATFAYRIIVIVTHYSSFWAQALWYIGTIGFVIYFLHRYQVSEKRARLIKNYQLIEKIKLAPNLTQDDIDATEYILKTLLSTKEKWNYIFIFVMSTVAFAIGLYLDFFSK